VDTLHTVNAGCFALLDDCNATDADRRSRLYTGHIRTLSCDAADCLPAFWDALQQELRAGKFAVGLFTYELGAQMHAIAPYGGPQPVSQVLLFEQCERLSSAEVDTWLAGHAQQAGIANLRRNVSEAQFADAVARIHAYIEAGDTYQVNYTWRLRFDAYGATPALYRMLRARQPVPYGALIVLPDDGAVLSLSPELFVHHEDGTLTTRPMKGTAPACGDPVQDAARGKALAADIKNRAENLMIVDLLRNDLGRVAESGAVTVPRLFDVSRYGSVLQMTSTVCARLRDGLSLAEVFEALYPCGSITGAPKRRTMQIVRELETDPRGVYTGAIGWFDAPPDGRGIGDFCLSVPIRTLTLQPPEIGGLRAGEMGVGAGIVHDSVAADEYEECRVKAAFLTGLTAGFELFETIHATHADGCRHLQLHLQRLRTSAAYFGFAYEEQAVRNALEQACAALPPGPHRLRLALDQMGGCAIRCAPLAPIAEPVKVLPAPQPTTAGDLFLRHKTTVRETYDAAWLEAERRGAFDMLFCNTHGELTEGGRTNVFVKLDGRWYTPPLAAGVLPGVMRSVLLADPAWNASEKRLTWDDLLAAEALVVCNALRGALPAVLDFA
jgi:para-aminobenzoate synthetase/4-amino-4-deoxychorismate lyase